MKDIKMPDGQRTKQIQESGCRCLGIIQDSEIKNHVMKDKIRTEYLRRVRKLAKSELYARNVFMGINQCVLGVVMYSVQGLLIGLGEIWNYWIERQEKY